MTASAAQMDTGQILAEILVGGDLRIHLIGVAGSGMSGIAALLMALGHRVSGSDRVTTVEVERLQKLGLDFCCPHSAEPIDAADLVIFSSAIRPDNIAYAAAIRSGISMVRRADALAAIMNFKRGIVVAGMHGKTTTAAMAAHVLRECGLRPSHYVGAEIPILGTNAHWDAEGEWFVAEGDESDGTLSLYRPEQSIVLNIEEEHLDYYENLAAIEHVFGQLLDHTSGHVFYCADDAIAARICAGREGAISFGESTGAHYRFTDLTTSDFQSRFRVHRHGELLGEVALKVPGKHNRSNALSVIALAVELGASFETIAGALQTFRGAKRRFEIKYVTEDFLVIDDYGHHPSEIRATLATAKSAGRKRVVTLFQPHRYSRTAALKDAFGEAFGDSTTVFVTDIYPASELPIEGVTGKTITDAIAANGHPAVHWQPDRRRALHELGRLVEPGDLILTLGAGDIHEQATELAADLAVLEEIRSTIGAGVARLYEPLAKHTTLRVGGPAQFWVEPESEAGFAALVRLCAVKTLPLLVIGRGSNLLVREGGVRGVVAHLALGEFKKIDVNGVRITAGVGVKLKELSYAARDAQIGGMEWMEGIPGNVGGGLRMNAGAMGSETFDNVVTVRLVDATGEIRTKTPGELEVRYRGVSSLRTSYAVSAIFEGTPRPLEEIKRLLDESLHKRRTTQPKEASAGCIFKNPATIPAGKLVEELGLKDSAIGKARVSEIHGNFIVNDGGASASDVLALIAKIQGTAREKRGIDLETEVEIVGEP